MTLKFERERRLMTTPSSLTSDEIIKLYNEGKRDFRGLSFNNTLEFMDWNFDDIDFSNSWFDGTFLNVSLRNARFCLSSIKTVVFKDCDLTFANFKMAGLEATTFENCKIAHACFDSASVYEELGPGTVPPGMSREPN